MDPRPATVREREYPTAAGRVEHVTLSGEPGPGETPAKQPHRITLRRYAHAGPRPGCVTELSILDGHYLGVRYVRPKAALRQYQFDLRFANPLPVRIRRIPWAWLTSALGLTALGAALLVSGWSAGDAMLSHGAIGGALAISIGVAALCGSLRCTTESLQLRSIHGDATLVSIAGRVGSTHRHKSFFGEVARSIDAAGVERATPARQFLCDEMREHYRLYQAGILSESVYEASKARILAAH